MKCQICSRDDASVHVLDIRGGRRRNLWLCLNCARELNPGNGPAGEDPHEPEDDLPVAEGAEDETLASFMGQAFESLLKDDEGAEPACPGCGYTLEIFSRNNRLGCAQCYRFFRARMQSMLGRFHRHASHLGKVPSQSGVGPSRLAEITRVRVALEKAIVAEDFEGAARLRDQVRELEIETKEPEEGS